MGTADKNRFDTGDKGVVFRKPAKRGTGTLRPIKQFLSFRFYIIPVPERDFHPLTEK
jgi:hypothetical protein